MTEGGVRSVPEARGCRASGLLYYYNSIIFFVHDYLCAHLYAQSLSVVPDDPRASGSLSMCFGSHSIWNIILHLNRPFGPPYDAFKCCKVRSTRPV